MTGKCFVVGFEFFTKYRYRPFIGLVDLFDWYIKVREDEGDDGGGGAITIAAGAADT